MMVHIISALKIFNNFNHYSYEIVDLEGGKKIMTRCKKCGRNIDEKQEVGYAGVEYNYCDKCLSEFEEAIENGAVIIRRRIGREDHIFRWEIYQGKPPKDGERINAEAPMNMNQLQAIVRGRELAKKHNVPTIFKYEPHMSMWFLEDYLKAHPNIKKDVREAEKGIIEKIKDKFGVKKK